VVDGALHPVGTVNCTWPPLVPPVAAVYVNVTVRCVALALTASVLVPRVPEPSGAKTSIDGDDASARGVSPLSDVSAVSNACAPVVEPAVAPGPPPVMSP